MIKYPGANPQPLNLNTLDNLFISNTIVIFKVSFVGIWLMVILRKFLIKPCTTELVSTI